MTAPTKPTKRQLEAMLNLYLGDQRMEGERITDPYLSYELEYAAQRGEELPPIMPWGRPERFGGHSNKGGAYGRMRTRMAELGFLQERTSRHGRTYHVNALTAKAMHALRAAHPTLPDIDTRLAAQETKEAEAAAAAKAEAEAARAEFQRQQAERKAAKGAACAQAMAAVLQDYQVQHTLTTDQLQAMWQRIIKEDFAL
jgi:DNA-binding transcriptional MerR regulator